MGRGHGTTRGSGPSVAAAAPTPAPAPAPKRDFSSIPGLKAVRDPQVRKELIQALDDYEQEFGVKLTNISLQKLKKNVFGEHTTTNGKSEAIHLDSKLFKSSEKEVTAVLQKNMNRGWGVKTKNPIRATLVHELAHATWSDKHNSPTALRMHLDVMREFQTFRKDKSTYKSGWGGYSKTSYGEWFAEGITKHVYGTRDKYTETLVGLIKKHGL